MLTTVKTKINGLTSADERVPGTMDWIVTGLSANHGMTLRCTVQSCESGGIGRCARLKSSGAIRELWLAPFCVNYYLITSTQRGRKSLLCHFRKDPRQLKYWIAT